MKCNRCGHVFPEVFSALYEADDEQAVALGYHTMSGDCDAIMQAQREARLWARAAEILANGYLSPCRCTDLYQRGCVWREWAKEHGALDAREFSCDTCRLILGVALAAAEQGEELIRDEWSEAGGDENEWEAAE